MASGEVSSCLSAIEPESGSQELHSCAIDGQGQPPSYRLL